MKYRFIAILVTAGVLAGAGVAQAQSSRLYFAGYLGLNTFTESEFSETTTGSTGDMEFKNAYSLAGALGLRLTPQWRLEGEISRRSANMDRIDIAGNGTFELGGELETWLYMLNLHYDVDWQWKNFQPFLTAGVGFAAHEAQINGSAVNPAASDDSLGFAWSMGGGLKYRVNPDFAITSGYRYVGTNDLEVDSYDFEYSTHELRLGLEYDLPTDWLD